jgi:hypothetical protein
MRSDLRRRDECTQARKFPTKSEETLACLAEVQSGVSAIGWLRDHGVTQSQAIVFRIVRNWILSQTRDFCQEPLLAGSSASYLGSLLFQRPAPFQQSSQTPSSLLRLLRSTCIYVYEHCVCSKTANM